jgi:hypothetical protein
MRELQEAPALGAAADDAGYALSASQLPFFLLAQLHPDSACGNGALLLRLRGELDEAALEASLRVLYEHHENWRTSASVCAGRAVARVHPFEARFIERIDRSGAPLSEQELEHLLHERVRRPFKLGEPPWLRVHWLKLGPRAHVLLFVAHHVGFDGYSLYKLLPDQLAALYAARRSGASSELPQSAPYRATRCRSVGRSPIHVATCSTRRGASCPWARRVSSTSAATAWRKVTWAGPSSARNVSFLIRSRKSQKRACTAPAIA